MMKAPWDADAQERAAKEAADTELVREDPPGF